MRIDINRVTPEQRSLLLAIVPSDAVRLASDDDGAVSTVDAVPTDNVYATAPQPIAR